MSQAVSELAALLRTLNPVLNDGVYVYSVVPAGTGLSTIAALATFRETEGTTVITSEAEAVRAGLPVLFRAAWITLEVHSDLQAIGLTAAFSRALGDAGISCNVVAAAHHDHIFVPIERAGEAIARLRALQSSNLSAAVTDPHASAEPAVHIVTEIPDCVLRPWHKADQPALLLHANNHQVWRNLTERFPHPYTEADVQAWLELASGPGPTLHLAIEFEGQAVGGIGVIALEGVARHTGRFGYWLAEPHWGKGIATAAARAMVAHVMSDDRFARLEAPVFSWNPASMRVLEKVGFVREGVLRRSVFKDGQFTDSVVYALVRDDA